MSLEFNQINLESKKFNKRNRILIAILIFILLFLLHRITILEKNSAQSNYSRKPASFISGGEFSYSKEQTSAKETANEILYSEEIKDSGEFSITDFLFNKKQNTEKIPDRLILNGTPQNLILIVIDGAGVSYFSDETTPNILSLSNYGFFTTNMQVKVPSTTESHAIIFTGIYNESYDWTSYLNLIEQNKTIFDSAKFSNYTLFAIMGKGDSPELISKMDAALFDADNNFFNLKSNLNLTAELFPSLTETFSLANNLSSYKNRPDLYAAYNDWIKDSVKSAIKTLAQTDEKFILVVNFPAVDEGGHENFDSYYLQTLKETDSDIKEIFDTLLETNLLNKTALIITADHGMQKTKYGRGAHADIYNDLTLKVPFLLISPQINLRNSESLYFNDDISPTILKLLNLPQNQGITGYVIGEIFSNETFIDVGILNLTYNSVSINITVQNFANLSVEDELCLNVTARTEYAVACANLTLSPKEKKIVLFKFPFSQSGIYKISSFLARSDSNFRNDILEIKAKIPPVHDLGIEEIYIEKDSANQQKIKVKVRVLNYGDYAEDKLALSIKIHPETRNYGPYSDEIKISKTVSSTWTLNQTGLFQIEAKITGYDNFGLDAEQENNIKSTYVHIS